MHGDISQYDLVRRGMATPFVSPPGKEFHYSGEGLQVLGRIVEKLSGQRLDYAMSTRVLEPLGVQHHASLGYLAPDVFVEIAAGRASKTNTFIPSPFNEAKKVCVSWASKPTEDLYGQQWGQADACGASMLSAVNLLRFVTFGPRLFGKDLERESLTPPKTPPYSNGLGWGVGVDKDGHRQWGHTGAIMGCRSIAESLSSGEQYAVLMAGDRDADFDKICAAVREYAAVAAPRPTWTSAAGQRMGSRPKKFQGRARILRKTGNSGGGLALDVGSTLTPTLSQREREIMRVEITWPGRMAATTCGRSSGACRRGRGGRQTSCRR